MNEGEIREADVPAEQPEARPSPWLSQAHVDQGRSPGAQAQAGQGAQAHLGVDTVTDRDRSQWRSLQNRSDFQKVYEQGVKQVGRLLVVYLLQADDTARAVVASRKVGGAVRRNRAKRLLREARRLGVLGRPDGVRSVSARFFPDTGAETSGRSGDEGLWVVLVARHAILGASSREVREELDRLLGEETSAAAPLDRSRRTTPH